MGLRLRLKASVSTAGYPPEVQVILRALKTYGMIVADNGGLYTTPWPLSDKYFLASYSYSNSQTDATGFGGQGRVDPEVTYPAPGGELSVYLPCRTAAVFSPVTGDASKTLSGAFAAARPRPLALG